jgi:hypothetical protein
LTGKEAYDKLQVGDWIYAKYKGGRFWLIGNCTEVTSTHKTLKYGTTFLGEGMFTFEKEEQYYPNSMLWTKFNNHLIATNPKERTVIETLYNINL